MNSKKTRITSLILLCALIAFLLPITAKSGDLPVFLGENVSAESAILIDLDQKTVIFEKNSKNSHFYRWLLLDYFSLLKRRSGDYEIIIGSASCRKV